MAFDKTCRKRETLSLLEHYEEILCSISEDSTLQNLWKNYCRKYKYASHIEFSTNLEIIKQLMSQMLEIEWNNILIVCIVRMKWFVLNMYSQWLQNEYIIYINDLEYKIIQEIIV